MWSLSAVLIALLYATSVNAISPQSNSISAILKGDTSDDKYSKKKSSAIGTSSLNGNDDNVSNVSSFSSSAKTAKIAEGLAKRETEKSLLKSLAQSAQRRDNIGHNQSTKIKVVSKVKTPTPSASIRKAEESEDNDESSDEGDENASVSEKTDQSSAVKKQILMGVTYMIASRFVMKLDFTKPKIIQLCRIVFAIYLLGSQLLFYLVKRKIEEKNDTSEIEAAQGFSLKGLQEKIPMLSTLGIQLILIFVFLLCIHFTCIYFTYIHTEYMYTCVHEYVYISIYIAHLVIFVLSLRNTTDLND
jgi:hypothetical protein